MMKAVGKNEKGEIIWESKNGFGETFIGTMDEIKKQHMALSSDELIGSMISPENITVYRKKGKDKVQNDGNPQVNEDGKKAINEEYKKMTSNMENECTDPENNNSENSNQ